MKNKIVIDLDSSQNGRLVASEIPISIGDIVYPSDDILAHDRFGNPIFGVGDVFLDCAYIRRTPRGLSALSSLEHAPPDEFNNKNVCLVYRINYGDMYEISQDLFRSGKYKRLFPKIFGSSSIRWENGDVIPTYTVEFNLQ